MGEALATHPVELSRGYLAAVRREENPAEYRVALSDLDADETASALSTDADRRAFWLNVYNAAVQDRLARDPGAFGDRGSFFGDRWLSVADRDLSLDYVEHRLLRRSRWKYGAGYLPVPRPGTFERRFRVAVPDPRVHFALNCGAASCPPVRGYDPGDLDAQLEAMTTSYLQRTVEFEPGGRRVAGLLYDGVVRVPRPFLWYRGDWGRKPHVLRFLRRYGVVPDDARPRLSYLPYDWSLDVGDFLASE
jgi:hypothetical protein